MPNPTSGDKIIIETADSKKKVEFTASEFNELSHLIVTRLEGGEKKEVRILRITSKKKLLMN